MAGHATEPFRKEHEELLEHVAHVRALAREVDDLSLEERAVRVERILGFVRDTLLPHAEAEERVLYPAVAGILGHPEATAPMLHDHVVIREYAAALAEADPADGKAHEELLYGLHALLVAHFRKEEELYLPLVEAQGEEAARRLLAELGAVAGHAH